MKYIEFAYRDASRISWTVKCTQTDVAELGANWTVRFISDSADILTLSYFVPHPQHLGLADAANALMFRAGSLAVGFAALGKVTKTS